MSLYETWQQVAQAQQTREAYDAFWNTYFAAETQNYKKPVKVTGSMSNSFATSASFPEKTLSWFARIFL